MLGLLAREYVCRIHDGEIAHGERVLDNESIKLARLEHSDAFRVVVEAYAADAVLDSELLYRRAHA